MLAVFFVEEDYGFEGLFVDDGLRRSVESLDNFVLIFVELIDGILFMNKNYKLCALFNIVIKS